MLMVIEVENNKPWLSTILGSGMNPLAQCEDFYDHLDLVE